MADKTIPALKILRGKVGINTATPSQQLHVNGEAYIFTGSTSVRTLSGIFKADTIENSAGASNLKLQTESGGNKHIEITPNGTGNVGIGTNAPDSLLMVYKSGADSIIHVRGASSGADARVRINGYNSSELYIDRNGVGRFAFRRTTGTDDLSLLKLNDNYTDNSTIMFWDYSSGSVGIGTANPQALFQCYSSAIIGHADQQTTQLTIEALNTAGSPAATTKILMKGYEGRGIGTFYTDSSYSGQEWFCGMNYSAAFGYWNVGYDASGGQAEYNANTLFRVKYTGRVEMLNYGSGTFTGTPTYKLAVDSSGNIIETAIGAGQVDGSGTANYLSLWSDSDTLTNSIISQSGTAYAQVNGGVRITGNHTDSGSQLNIWCDSSGHGRAAVYDWYFYTGGNSARTNLALFLKHDGNVGIGESNPDKPLHIKGTNTAGIVIENTTNATNMDIDWYNNVGSVSGRIRYSEGTGDFSFMPNQSTNAVVFKYDGKVGINTSSPSANLHVAASSDDGIKINANNAIIGQTSGTAATQLLFWSGTDAYLGRSISGLQNGTVTSWNIRTGGADRVIINSTGLGIGGVSPASNTPLHIYTNSASDQTIFLDNDSSGQTGITLRTDRNTDGNAANFIYFDAADDGGNNTRYATIESFIVDNTNGTEDGALRFSVMAGGNDTESMTISARSGVSDIGFVGIGTNAPAFPLHVYGSNQTNGSAKRIVAFLDTTSAAAGTGAGIALGGYTNGTASAINDFGVIQGIKENSTAGNYASALTFHTRANGANTAEQMRINSDGNVGIGTNNPAYPLQVYYAGGVGIGLQVKGTANRSKLAVSDNDTTAYVIAEDSMASFGRSDALSTSNLNINSSGSVGIGTVSPKTKLDLNDGAMLIRNITYAADQNDAYLIAGTDGYTGATTNWNTYGIQHRIKTNNGGVPRVTIDTPGGERFCVNNNGSVGIGVADPIQKLHVNGGQIRVNEGTSGVAIGEYQSGAVIWIDGANGDFSGGDYFNIRANNSAQLTFGYAGGQSIYITSNGRLGIGANNPAAALEVLGDAIIGSAAAKIKTYSDSTYSGIYNGSSLSSDESIYFGAGTTYFINDGSSSLVIDSNQRVQLKGTDYQLQYVSGSHIWYTRLTSGGTFAIHKNGVADYLQISSTGAVTIPSPSGTHVALTVKGGNNLVDNILLNLTNQSGVGVLNVRNNGALYVLNKFSVSAGGVVQWGDAAAHGRLTWDTDKAVIGGIGSNNLSLIAEGTEVVNSTSSTWDFKKEARFPNNTGVYFLHADGSATAGIKLDTSDHLDFRTGGANSRMILDDNGNLGIAMNPTGARLEVQKNSGNIFKCRGDSNSTRFNVGASGACEIEANTGNYPLKITNADSGDKGLHVSGCSAMIGRTNVATSYPATAYDLFLGNGNNDGAVLLLYNYAGNYHSALVRYHNNTLKLGLNNSNSADSIFGTTAISVTNTGVGIGVAAPTSLLQVSGDLGNSAFLAYFYNSGTQTEDNGLNVQIASSGSSAQALRVNTGGDDNAFIVAGDGQVGVGLTPSSFTHKFNVNGTAYVSGSLKIGAFTLPNTDGSNGQVLQTNGSGTVTWATAGGGGVTGSGTDQYVPRWNGTGALEDSNIFSKDGNSPSQRCVGIGTNNPGYLFHVYGNAACVEDAVATIVLNGTVSGIAVALKSDGGVFKLRDNNNGKEGYHVKFNNTGYHKWFINDTERMRLSSSGKLKVGTSGDASYTLDVSGDGRLTSDLTISGNVGINGFSPSSSYGLQVGGNAQVSGSFTAYSKSFLIDHPTKENKKLEHGCLEGPEFGVYHRGRAQSNTITLPDYWTALVREESITVQLTPKGSFQHLYVVSQSLTEIVIGAADGETIDCFYTIYGERADIDRLEVEKEV